MDFVWWLLFLYRLIAVVVVVVVVNVKSNPNDRIWHHLDRLYQTHRPYSIACHIKCNESNACERRDYALALSIHWA